MGNRAESLRVKSVCRFLLQILLLFFSVTVPAQDNWVAVSPSPGAASDAECVLESVRRTFHDGYQDTVAFLRLDKQTLQLITDANIDFDPASSGLKVDNREFISATGVTRETILLFEQDMDRIVSQFIAGNTVRLQLRLWPSWPDMGEHHLEFSLGGFTRAWNSLGDCSDIPAQQETGS